MSGYEERGHNPKSRGKRTQRKYKQDIRWLENVLQKVVNPKKANGRRQQASREQKSRNCRNWHSLNIQNCIEPWKILIYFLVFFFRRNESTYDKTVWKISIKLHSNFKRPILLNRFNSIQSKLQSFSVHMRHLQNDFIDKIQFEASFGAASIDNDAAQVHNVQENVFEQIQLWAALWTLAWKW